MSYSLEWFKSLDVLCSKISILAECGIPLIYLRQKGRAGAERLFRLRQGRALDQVGGDDEREQHALLAGGIDRQ
ncbi:hypothetical protein D3C85_1854500 [compost metagenome]